MKLYEYTADYLAGQDMLKRAETEEEFAEAERILKFLSYFETIEDDSIIANNSIIREFIGGSVLV